MPYSMPRPKIFSGQSTDYPHEGTKEYDKELINCNSFYKVVRKDRSRFLGRVCIYLCNSINFKGG